MNKNLIKLILRDKHFLKIERIYSIKIAELKLITSLN